MRKLIGFLLVLALAAYLKFGNTVTDVDYKVKNSYGELPSQLLGNAITYRVPGVVRVAGADIYRPEGYFTQPLLKVPKESVAPVADAMVKTMSVGFPMKLDPKKAKLMGLEPAFTFWENNGKWVLLFATICLVCIFFWR